MDKPVMPGDPSESPTPPAAAATPPAAAPGAPTAGPPGTSASVPASAPTPPAEDLSDATVVIPLGSLQLPPAPARDEPDDDATRVITPSEAQMAEHLARQLEQNQATAAAAAAAGAAAAAAAADPSWASRTSLPISPDRAAQLAAELGTPGSSPTPAAPHRPLTMTGRFEDHTAFAPTQITPTTLGRRLADGQPGAEGLPAPGTGMGAGTLPGRASAWGRGGDGLTLPAAAEGTMEGSMRQVGRYQVKSRLGRGGMATVFRAHDPQIARDVAIKFLHSSLSEDEECRMRFLREARAAGGLSHPNIVVVHDVGEIENRPYMAMELIDGAPLNEKLDQVKQMPLRQTVIIGLQLARALEYAHGRGIVHRDIKPGNIMLLGDGMTIKVADFGIAHMDDGTGEQRTMVGAVMGTPQYMSPEQTRGDKVDGRSDLFSAGIVLYQMLTGERPFRGDSMVAVVTKIANEDPAPLNQRRPDCPPSLRRVVDRCLAKRPEQRYQSGKELAEALQKVLGEIDEAQRERDKPRIVPLRVKWALAMALLVAVVMGVTSFVVTQRQYAALMGQATDYGASLARFIAAQNAAAVLGDEWDAVDVQVQEIMKTRNFERVSVLDMTGQVRVSSQAALVGQPYKPEGVEKAGVDSAGTAYTRYRVDGEDVLGFEAPVLFQGKQIGRVHLGILEKPLTQVARLSITLMIILAVVTVLAVGVAMYFVANWFAKPIRLVGDSMAEIGKGRFDHRIAEQRNDEFGLLFKAFDDMAAALQQRAPDVQPAPPTLLPGGAPTGATGPGTA